jgi:hypothetical protein
MMPAHLPRHPPRDDLPHQHTKSKNICRLGGLASAHQLGRLVAESSTHCRTQMGCSSSSCLHQPATWNVGTGTGCINSRVMPCAGSSKQTQLATTGAADDRWPPHAGVVSDKGPYCIECKASPPPRAPGLPPS